MKVEEKYLGVLEVLVGAGQCIEGENGLDPPPLPRSPSSHEHLCICLKSKTAFVSNCKMDSTRPRAPSHEHLAEF